MQKVVDDLDKVHSGLWLAGVCQDMSYTWKMTFSHRDPEKRPEGLKVTTAEEGK